MPLLILAWSGALWSRCSSPALCGAAFSLSWLCREWEREGTPRFPRQSDFLFSELLIWPHRRPPHWDYLVICSSNFYEVDFPLILILFPFVLYVVAIWGGLPSSDFCTLVTAAAFSAARSSEFMFTAEILVLDTERLNVHTQTPPPQITVHPTLFISIHMSSSLLFLLSLLSPACKLFTAEAQQEVCCLLVKRMTGQEWVSPYSQTMEEMLLTQPFFIFCWVFIIVRWGLRNRCDKFLIFDEPSKWGYKCFCVFTYLGC